MVKPVDPMDLKETAGGEEIPEGIGTKHEENFVDDFLKLRRQAKAERLVKETMGEGNNGNNGNTENNLAVQIVTKAMDMNKEAAKVYKDLADAKSTEAVSARKESNEATNNMYGIMLRVIENMQQNLIKQQNDLAAGNPPRKPLDTINEAKELLNLLDTIRPKTNENPGPVAPQPQENPNFTLALEKMRSDNALALRRLDLEIAHINNEFNLRRLEFEDERKRKREEFEESSRTRNNALNVISDIGQSIAAAAQSKFGGGVANKQQSEAPQPAPGTPNNTVRTYTCEVCKTELALPDKGTITCPGCGTQYGVTEDE